MLTAWLQVGNALHCLSAHPNHFLIIIIFVNLENMPSSAYRHMGLN